MDNYKKEMIKEWEKYQQEYQNGMYPNIMILGVTGAGKSSLINTVFGANDAKVSDIKPETKGYDNIYYGKKYGRFVNLIDTAGYELEGYSTYYSKVHNIIENGLNGEYVHIIWYCISITKERIEDMDVKILSSLMKEEKIRKRLCIVFTKCDEDDDEGNKAKALKGALNLAVKEKNILYQFDCFEVSSDKDYPLELDKLIEWSANKLDNIDLKNKFIASQFNNLKMKRQQADELISSAVKKAAAIGATPIPFSDAVLLTPIQIKLSSDIVNIYGLEMYFKLSSSFIAEIVLSNLGKSLVSNILKFIPFAGSIVGAVINASMASAITYAFGKTISSICYDNIESYLKNPDIDFDNIFKEDIFKARFKMNLKYKF